MVPTHQETNQAGSAPECLYCPLCMGVAALRQARPEAMEHLLKAGVELLAAVHSLLDVPNGNARGPAGLQRIEVG